jgi:pyochelin biosynthesis protein PchC
VTRPPAGPATGVRGPSGLWLRHLQPAPGSAGAPGRATRLVCLPHAGGSVTAYHPLSAALATDVDVVAVQYPGRQDRRGEACVEDIDELADRVVEALAHEAPATQPFALLGHSMGAIVAFEVARRLEAGAGVPPPVRLFASGRRAPSRYRHENLHERGADALLGELRALDGTHAQLLEDPEVLAMFLPSLMGDYRAIETYRSAPGATVACPVTALVGDEDPRATLDEVRAWADHTTGGFEMHVFAGGHFFLNDHVTGVAEVVTAALAS